MVFYLAKKEGLAAQEVAAWFLQTRKYSDLKTFKLDRIRGTAEIFYDQREAELLVLDCLRIIAENGVAARPGVKKEDGLAWEIEDFNERFPSLSFEGGGILDEEYTVFGSTVEELDYRERDSLLKIIIGMATGGYGHDLTAKKSPTVSAITEDIEKLGLVVSAETVRKYLKEASRLIERSK